MDCSTGEETWLTLEEAAAHPEIAVNLDFEEKRQAEAAARMKAEAGVKKQRDADLKVIKDKAATDPAFAALVRHLRIA